MIDLTSSLFDNTVKLALLNADLTSSLEIGSSFLCSIVAGLK